MLGMLFEMSLSLNIFSVAVSGIRCWSCENTDLSNCKGSGRMEYCFSDNQEACQTEVRFSEGKTLIVKTGCKQGLACFNNYQQNPAGAWMPTQCNHGVDNSVCRCCCEGDLCNKNREMLLCEFPPVGDTPVALPAAKLEKTCRQYPEIPKNGKMDCYGIVIRAFCKFDCDEGYKLNGYDMTICVRRGKELVWNRSTPICEKIAVCKPLPKSPNNGNKVCYGDGYVETSCVFGCDTGYVMIGQVQTTCKASKDGAEWNRKVPTCELVCKVLPKPPLNGKVKCDGRGEVGTVCTFQCGAGARINGRSTTMCVEKRGKQLDWNIQSPTCEPACDPMPNAPTNGKKNCSGSGEVGTTCVFECDGGFQLYGAVKTLCQNAARGLAGWSEQPPDCTPVCVSIPQAPKHGGVTCDGRGEIGTSCIFSCHDDFELKGALETNCQETIAGADWTKGTPLCDPIPTCDVAPQAPGNGSVQCGGAGELGTICQFACNEDFELHGKESTSCRREDDRAFWSNEPPFCKYIEPVCPPLDDFPNGKVLCDNEINTEGTTCRFECLNVNHKLVPQERSETRCSRQPELKWTVKHPCCVDCLNTKKDIMIAMDSSGSVSPKEWAVMIKFVQNIVRKFDVSAEAVQFSIFQFSSASRSDGLMYFGRYSKQRLIKQIGKMRRIGTGTMTDKALQYAQRRFQDSGNRQDVGDMLWVVTDGPADDAKDLKQLSEKLRKNGVEIFALAIGPVKELMEQMMLVTGDKAKVMVAKDISSITDKVSESIASKICKETCAS